MDTSKGSLILKAISADADTAEIIAYLSKRTKSIPPGKIPLLLDYLPVVLSRNVPQPIAAAVVDQLSQWGAQAIFLSAEGAEVPSASSLSEDGAPLPEPAEQSSPSRDGLFGWRLLMDRASRREDQGTLARSALEMLFPGLMLAILWGGNSVVAWPVLLLGLYSLPTLLAVFVLGRRQTLLTAVLTILLVVVLGRLHQPSLEVQGLGALSDPNGWPHLLAWGLSLLLTAWLAGSLHHRTRACTQQIRRTYDGLLFILEHAIIPEPDRENHGWRVGVYATRIAVHLGLTKEYIEDIRRAARLLDLGQEASARIVFDTLVRLHRDPKDAGSIRSPRSGKPPARLSDSLARVLPMVIRCNESTGTMPPQHHTSWSLPLGAKILAVADIYDRLCSPGPDQPGLSPLEARQRIMERAGQEFDAKVAHAFALAFDRGDMELPAIP